MTTTQRVLIGFAFAAVVAAVGALYAMDRSVRRASQERPPVTSFMRNQAAPPARTGVPLLRWTDAAALPPYVVCAVVKAEDRRFFVHSGFDGGQLWRAASGAATGARRMGGSTISQQLARNLFLSDARSLTRKALEAGYTVALESRLEKRAMLALYLNVVEWGPGVWGIDAAARHYFGIGPDSLTVAQAVFLASVLPNPRHAAATDPRVQKVERRVLVQLLRSRMITTEMLTRAADSLGLALTPPRALAPAPSAQRPAELIDSSGGLDCGLANELAAERAAGP